MTIEAWNHRMNTNSPVRDRDSIVSHFLPSPPPPYFSHHRRRRRLQR